MRDRGAGGPTVPVSAPTGPSSEIRSDLTWVCGMSGVTASPGQSDTQDVICHPQLHIPMAKDSICSPASAAFVAKLGWPRMVGPPGSWPCPRLRPGMCHCSVPFGSPRQATLKGADSRNPPGALPARPPPQPGQRPRRSPGLVPGAAAAVRGRGAQPSGSSGKQPG